jgi:lipopolysaccharide export system ATP-binding protein
MVLGTNNVVKAYKGRRVVDGVSLEVKRGQVVGLLGPNGAGKTTTFYMIVGLVPPLSGRVYLDSRDITRMPMYKRARLGIGYLAQEASAFRRLTVEQNLRLILELLPLTREEQKKKAEYLMDRFGITHIKDTPTFQLSGGERRRVEIARTLATEPGFILLDEPFTGIDPIALDDIHNIINELKRENIGILLTDHSVRETLRITDWSYIIHEGKVITSGTPEEVLEDPMARRFYFGDHFNI